MAMAKAYRRERGQARVRVGQQRERAQHPDRHACHGHGDQRLAQKSAQFSLVILVEQPAGELSQQSQLKDREQPPAVIRATDPSSDHADQHSRARAQLHGSQHDGHIGQQGDRISILAKLAWEIGGRPLDHEDVGQHSAQHKPEGQPAEAYEPGSLELCSATTIDQGELCQQQGKQECIERQEHKAERALRPFEIYHSPLAEPIKAHRSLSTPRIRAVYTQTERTSIDRALCLLLLGTLFVDK
jgi:hypothetical protein